MPFIVAVIREVFEFEAILFGNVVIRVKRAVAPDIHADGVARKNVRRPERGFVFVTIAEAEAFPVERLIRVARLAEFAVVPRAEFPRIPLISLRP